MSTTPVPFSKMSSATRSSEQWPESVAALADLTPEQVGVAFLKLFSHSEVGTLERMSKLKVDPRREGLGAAPALDGDHLVLLGGAAQDLIGSRFLSVQHGLAMPPPDDSDPRQERLLKGVLATLTKAGVASSALELGPGGLLVTVAQKLVAGAGTLFGARIDLHCFGSARTDVLLFGEGRARAVITTRPDRVGTVLSEAHTNGVPATVIGEITRDPIFAVSTRRLLAQWSIDELRGSLG